MSRGPALVLLLAECAPSGPVVSGLTDGASWEVAVDAATWPAGDATLRLTVLDAEGEPAEGVDVLLVAGMDGMEHAPEPAWCDAEGAGVHACPVRFSMPGLWNVEGTVFAEQQAEAFHLVVAVE